MTSRVVNHTCAILTAATGLGDPRILWKWAWLIVLLRILQKNHKLSHHGFLPKSPWKFCQSRRVTEVILIRSRGHSQILGSHSHKYCAYWSDHPWMVGITYPYWSDHPWMVGITYPRHMHKIPLITWQSWLSHIHGPTRFRSRHNSWNKVSGCRQGQESGEIGIVVSTHMQARTGVWRDRYCS